ncbi:Transmembrane protein 104 [Thelohanellus kitauei]|uniref:Transmembrane protein 104 n=1 Tax=Thelohanellus kitauei TaxID=669202 RepID=A0A0C2MAH2_THEKT|nr:Transmembrane protein 104 [Thelohanellus kitauei]
MIAYSSMRIYRGEAHDIEHIRAAGIPNFFGVTLYSFMCQHSLPSMVNYVKNKGAKFNYLILLSMCAAFVLYLSTVLTASFAFKGSELHSIYSMNFDKEGEGWFDDFLYYYLMVFPTIALSASYPIIGITLRENLISLTEIALKQPLKQPLRDWVAPVVAIVPSFVLVMLIPSAVLVFASYVGSYAGSFVQYFIPACLVLWARKTIKKEFPGVKMQHNKNSIILFRNKVIPSLVIIWTFVGIGIVTYYFITK